MRVGQHNGVEPHDANNVMTEHPHTTQNNPIEHRTENITEHTTGPGTKDTPAKRKQRVRGCGVPASVWFAPHPETPTTHSAPEDSHGHDGWAVAEIVRQFTGPRQYYTIARVTMPVDGEEVDVYGYRRNAEYTRTEDRWELSKRERDVLVAVIPVDPADDGESGAAQRSSQLRELFAAQLASHIECATGLLAEGGTLAIQLPRPHPGVGFADGTGRAIETARKCGFAYLQHIALVDSYIDHEGITPALPQADLDAFYAARAQGVPVHARSHSDLLIFRKTEKENSLA
jgi:hypothetical protein